MQDEFPVYLLKIQFVCSTLHVNDMDQLLTAVEGNNCYLFNNPQRISKTYNMCMETSRLSSACYAIKVITPLMSEDILKIIYYSYVHSIITYGIIFGGNSPHSTDFKIQKRIIWIMTKSRSTDSCRQFLKD